MSGLRWAYNFRSWSPTQSEWMLCTQCIQVEERERIHRFMFKKDAKAAMIGRLLLRKAVVEYTPIPYQAVRFGRTDKGKPYLLNEVGAEFRDLSFNVSHQGEYAVLAAEQRFLVGVDVMRYEEKSSTAEFFHTMRRQFTDQEWRIIKAKQTEWEQLKMFYRFWCLKESYVKALGIGIGFEVSRLDFLVNSDLSAGKVVVDTKLKVDDKPTQDWKFEEHEIADHCVAVAMKNNQNNVEEDIRGVPFTVLTYQDLMKTASSLSDSNADSNYWDLFNVKPETPGGRVS